MAQIIKQNNFTDFLLYKSLDWEIKVNVLLKNETVFLSQKSMWNLFWCSSDNIWLHLKNIFNSWELKKNQLLRISL